MREFEVICANSKVVLQQCLKIRNTVFVIEQRVPKELEIDEFDCLGGRCRHFLVRVQGEDAGTLRCMQMDEGFIKIQRFCFYKKFRKMGFGKRTMDYIEKLYCGRGYGRFVLHAQYNAVKFYESCGYERISDIFTEAGIKHIEMSKDI